MFQTPRRGRSSVPPGFLLLSVLALLALGSFPGLAQAESSGGAQYESELPNVPPQEGSGHHDKNPGGPKESGGGGGPEAEISTGSPGGKNGGNGGSNGPGGEGNTQQGSPAPEAGGKQNGDGSTPAGKKSGQAQPELKVGSPAASNSEGSSSPVVPILIAVAVLAAISIGAFYYRQRRQGSGSPISPNAS